MEQDTSAGKVISLAALAIALFMTLPRVLIATYLKANPVLALQVTWLDLTAKCLYAFAIAWLFLWMNVRGFHLLLSKQGGTWQTIFYRLGLNLILLLIIKWLFSVFNIPGQNGSQSRAVVFLFNVSLVVEVCICVLIAEIYRLLRNNQQQRISNEILLKSNAEAMFEVLKSQINPHFLFNSLNTINAMIDHDVDAAKRFVGNMSQVYRYILRTAGKSVVTVAEELEFTNVYLRMLKERHGESLLIEIEIKDDYLHHLLPPVSLQTLIENAVKHNVTSVSNPLLINVSIGHGVIRVSNSICLRKQPYTTSTGTGLLNLYQRYLYLCGVRMEISSKDNVFCVVLPLLQFSNGKYVMTTHERINN